MARLVLFLLFSFFSVVVVVTEHWPQPWASCTSNKRSTFLPHLHHPLQLQHPPLEWLRLHLQSLLSTETDNFLLSIEGFHDFQKFVRFTSKP
jgi:hypothetical protein